MIKLVDKFFVTRDGGDSAAFHGIVDCFDFNAFNWANHPSWYFVKNGICVRHPKDPVYSNPWCFSRDQLICLTAGLWGLKNRSEDVIDILKKPWTQFWFAQNIERDQPGSTKRPWPHKMTGGDPVDNGKWRWFDFADPLLPHHMLHLYNCARIKPPLLIKWFGSLLLHLSCVFNSQKIDNEQNQLQCMVKVAGPKWVDLYIKNNPMWEKQTYYYFAEQRGSPEFYNIILNRFPNPESDS